MTPEEQMKMKRYQDLMESSPLGEQESPDMVEETPSMNNAARAQADFAQTSEAGAAASQSGAGGIGAAGDATLTAGAMGGNPYVAGAGLALKGIGMVDDAKRRQEQAKIDAYNKKIMAQRSAIRNMFD